MALPVSQRTEAIRRRPQLDGGVQPLSEWAAALAPEPVREASEAHRLALLKIAEMKHAEREAVAAVERAGDEDRQAAEAAVTTGKPVPAATLPAAVQARDGARRAVV